MPRSKTEKTQHRENAEVQHSGVRGLVRAPHLFLSLSHVGEVLNNGFTPVFKAFEFDFEGLELGCFRQTYTTRFNNDVEKTKLPSEIRDKTHLRSFSLPRRASS